MNASTQATTAMSGMFIQCRELGTVDYEATWKAMQTFTEQRGDSTPDEIWVCEHPPVFTLGQAGDPAHLLRSGDIPLVKTDRGGQITYHGPGQLVVYPLLELKRYGLKVREYVALLEDAIIHTLRAVGLADAQRKPGAPGVYLPKSGSGSDNPPLVKVAALGIKVRRGCTYHGLSVNVAMDLAPFTWINPCGYEGLETVDLAGQGVRISLEEIKNHIVKYLLAALYDRSEADLSCGTNQSS